MTEDVVATARSVNGVPVRLTAERWAHITERHGVMRGRQTDVIGVIESPDGVYEGREETLMAIRREDTLYLVVIYKETSVADGFVVTAYVTRRFAQRKSIWTPR